MTDDSLGFEPVDDELRRRLDAAGPQVGDSDAVLESLRPRYRRAKRRHQMLVAGGSALAIVAIVGLGTAVVGSDGSGTRNVGVPPANSSAPDHDATTTTAPSPAPTTTPPSTAATAAGGNGPGTTTAPTVSAPPTASTRTYSSDGGTVTVKLENGALSIVSTKAAAGYSEERTDDGPDRVEVRFTSTDTQWRIRVDLVNGTPVEETTQH